MCHAAVVTDETENAVPVDLDQGGSGAYSFIACASVEKMHVVCSEPSGVRKMKQIFTDRGLRLLTVVSLITIFGNTFAHAQQGQPVGTEAGKPPYNIIFVISDQRTYRLFAGNDYS